MAWQRIIDAANGALQQSDTANAPVFLRGNIIMLFSRLGIDATQVQWLVILIYVLLSILIAILGLIITRIIIRSVLLPVIRHSKNRIDDYIVESKALHRWARTVPIAILYFMLPGIFEAGTPGVMLLRRFLALLLLVPVTRGVLSLFSALNMIYDMQSFAKQRPIKGYIQIAKVFAVGSAIFLAIGVIFDVSPFRILGGLGAFSAVALLVFRDPLLALVASIQLTSNDMVRIGDWIEVPGHSANGTVIDMTLQSIRIQNWDKTIVAVPLYDLISRSFINWRGMEESGGRRIKRSLSIDISSIKFCTSEMLAKLKQYLFLHDYISDKEQEIMAANTEQKIADADILSRRAMTNLGTFRAYAYTYLHQHPHVNHELTYMVRQLPPTTQGIPLELYCFSAKQDWVEYEAVQADILDHLVAVMSIFELRIFQSPSGGDFANLYAKA